MNAPDGASAGEAVVGTDAVGTDAVGTDAVGTDAVGTDAVGTVRAWLAAVNAGDVAGVLARTAPDVVLVGPRGVAAGHDALRAWLGHAGAAFATRAMYARAGAVVVAQRAVWRDAGGAVLDEADVATRFRVAGRRVAEVERYDTTEAALAAAGLTAADAVVPTTGPTGGTGEP